MQTDSAINLVLATESSTQSVCLQLEWKENNDLQINFWSHTKGFFLLNNFLEEEKGKKAPFICVNVIRFFFFFAGGNFWLLTRSAKIICCIYYAEAHPAVLEQRRCKICILSPRFFKWVLIMSFLCQPHIWLHCPQYLQEPPQPKCATIADSICFLSAGCQQVIGFHTNDVSVFVI